MLHMEIFAGAKRHIAPRGRNVESLLAAYRVLTEDPEEDDIPIASKSTVNFEEALQHVIFMVSRDLWQVDCLEEEEDLQKGLETS